MPDWKKEIRARLASARLSPTREAEIVEELAQHLDDYYGELLAVGTTTAEAQRSTLEELNQTDLIARELKKIERRIKHEPIVLGAKKINLLGDVSRDLR